MYDYKSRIEVIQENILKNSSRDYIEHNKVSVNNILETQNGVVGFESVLNVFLSINSADEIKYYNLTSMIQDEVALIVSGSNKSIEYKTIYHTDGIKIEYIVNYYQDSKTIFLTACYINTYLKFVNKLLATIDVEFNYGIGLALEKGYYYNKSINNSYSFVSFNKTGRDFSTQLARYKIEVPGANPINMTKEFYNSVYDQLLQENPSYSEWIRKELATINKTEQYSGNIIISEFSNLIDDYFKTKSLDIRKT